MKVEGYWLFEGHQAETIWSLLHDPAALIQVVPSMHHLVKLGPDDYQFVLQPSAAVLDVADLAVGLTFQPAEEAAESPFSFEIRAAGKEAMTGMGAVHLENTAGGAQMIYEVDGAQVGALADYSDFLLETQLRAGIRRFCSAVERYLAGERATPAAVPAARTANEIWLLLFGAAFLLLIFLWFRRERGRD